MARRTGDNSWQRLGYEAAQAARSQSYQARLRTIATMRHEPTWGDQDKILDIIQQIRPDNHASLLTAFGLPVYGPKHLQIVRNACAHKHRETLSDVNRLLLDYSVTSIRSPTDIIWGIDNLTNQCAIYQWIDDLQLIALEASQ
ncbi:MAG: hypothetical protein R2911_24815 [Caldilineaceae bacterium]